MRPAHIALAGLAALGLAYWYTTRHNQAEQAGQVDTPPGGEEWSDRWAFLPNDGPQPEMSQAAETTDQPGSNDLLGTVIDTAAEYNPFSIIHGYAMGQQTADANVQAFLAMIRFAEGTARAADPYRVCYAYRHTIQSLDDHPALTGEWSGEPLDNLGGSYVGKKSTAAGAYQIIRGTWQGCKRSLGLGDFGPESQDRAAVLLIEQAGALQLVKEGQFERAVSRCSGTWASLPGSTAGQPIRRMQSLADAYTSAGGTIA